MKIIELIGKNIKGKTFKHLLGKATAFIGDNFTGKTARLEAVKLALLGYLPKIKSNSEIFTFSSGSEMTVAAKMEDETSYSRTWKQHGKSIKFTGTEGEAVPITTLDAEAFFALPEKARINLIFSTMQVDNMDRAGIDAKLVALRGHAKLVDVQGAETVLEEARALLPADGTLQEIVEAAITAASEKQKLAKENAEQFTKTIQGINNLRLSDTSEPVNEGAVKGKIEKAQIAINRLHEENGGLMTNKKNADATARAIAKLEQEIEEIEGSLPPDDMIKPEADIVVELETAREAVERERIKHSSAFSDREKVVQQINNLNINKTAQGTKLTKLTDRLATLEDELKEKSAHENCPTCGAKRKGWKEALESEYKLKLDPIRADIEKQKPLAEAAVNDYQAAASVGAPVICDDALRDAERTLKRLEGELTTARLAAKLPAMNKQLAEHKANKPEVSEVRIEKIAQEIAQLESEITDNRRLLQKVDNAKADEKRLAEADEQARIAEVEKLVYTLVIAEFNAVKESLMGDAFKPLLERAAYFTRGIFQTPLEYRDGEMGRFIGPIWICSRRFSGTEEAIFFAAICGALGMSSPAKIIITDEMGRMDEANKKQFIKNIMGMLDSGMIDQWLAVDVTAADWHKVKGLTIIETNA